MLTDLPVEEGFRLRGLETTRLDTFLDAAFAFVLTLLVISFDELPSNREELLDAVKLIPAFAASFMTLMVFWISHRTWSRRYGFETRRTVHLSLALIFVVLVYVYPLRVIFESMFASLTNDYLPTTFGIDDYVTLRTMFVAYSAGFLSMCLLMRQLYAAPLARAAQLGLTAEELVRTRVDVIGWTYSALFAVTSVLIAVFMPDGPWIPLAGYIYFVMLTLRPLLDQWLRRRLVVSQPPAPTPSGNGG